jgi:hypothetical protein
MSFKTDWSTNNVRPSFIAWLITKIEDTFVGEVAYGSEVGDLENVSCYISR